MFEQGIRRLAMALAIVAVVASPALGEFNPKIAAGGGTVTINGRAAIRFQAANGTLSPADRARITAERLTRLVDQRESAYSVFAKGDRTQARVMAGETLICIVARRDAKLGRTSPLALAGSWAANIRSLLLMPAVIVSDQEVTVPLGESRRVFVTGAATGPISAKSDTSAIASASPGDDGRYVEIIGQAIGQATVAVEVEGELVPVRVSVKKYAGALPGAAFAEVTGSPCPTTLVSYAASQAVLRSAVVEPGSNARVERVEGAQIPLQAGVMRPIQVAVTIKGEGYLDYSGTCQVGVHCAVMPREEVRQLFYSNNPERLTKYQELFAGKLEPDMSTRVLYHHQNAIGKRARLLVEIVNPTANPAAFRVFRAVSAPLVDTVLVGYIASAGFLRNQFYNASVIEVLPPRSRLVLVSDVLSNQETSSGILQIRQTDGGNGAYLRIAALPPEIDALPVGAVVAAPENIALQLSDHVYPAPLKKLDFAYVVGKQWAFIPIGKHAIGSSDAQRKLDGNYGVTYDIRVRMENPTDREKKVIVLFDPTAGLASGVFVIDGSFVSAKYAQPPKEVPLATYRLKPGEVRLMNIMTLPVAGSNYPATLVVRS